MPISSGASSKELDFGTVIVGAAAPGTQTVTLDKNGMDGTYYEVQVLEDATSDVSGGYNAFHSSGTDSRKLNVGLTSGTDTPGFKSGLIVVDNLDVTTSVGAGRGDNDGDDFIDLSLIVLDHSNASFSSPFDQNSMVLDLGAVCFERREGSHRHG